MGDLIPLRKGKAATKQAVSFAELAQPFLDRGIPVFPVQRNEKRPFLETAGFHDATTNKKQIHTWDKGKKFRGANIGIPTGERAGFVVIDLDVTDEVDGVKAFRDLCSDLDIDLPETYQVSTPSGGQHLYFCTRSAKSIRNSAKKLGPGIDVRGEGGYVVGEGSKIKGKRYKCIDGALEDIAALPKNLRLAIQDAKSSKTRRTGSSKKGPKIVEGERNEKLFQKACGLFREGYDLDLTLNLIRTFNQSICNPPLDAKEMLGIVQSAARYEVPEPDTGEQMLTDMGAARRLAIANEGTLAYVHELGKFFHRVKNRHWQKNPGIEYVLAKKAARDLQNRFRK